MLVLTGKRKKINPDSGREENFYRVLDTNKKVDNEGWLYSKQIPKGVFVLGGNGFSGYEIEIDPSTDTFVVLDFHEGNTRYLVTIIGEDTKIKGNLMLERSHLEYLAVCGFFNVRVFNHKFYDYSGILYDKLSSKIRGFNPLTTDYDNELLNTNKGKLLSAKMKVTGHYQDGWTSYSMPVHQCSMLGYSRPYKTFLRYALTLMSFRLEINKFSITISDGSIFNKKVIKDAFRSDNSKYSDYIDEIYSLITGILNNILLEEGLSEVLEFNFIGSRVEVRYRSEYFISSSKPFQFDLISDTGYTE